LICFSLPQGHPRGVFVSTIFSNSDIFGQAGVVCQSYNAGLGGPRQEHAQRSQN